MYTRKSSLHRMLYIILSAAAPFKYLITITLPTAPVKVLISIWWRIQDTSNIFMVYTSNIFHSIPIITYRHYLLTSSHKYRIYLSDTCHLYPSTYSSRYIQLIQSMCHTTTKIAFRFSLVTFNISITAQTPPATGKTCPSLPITAHSATVAPVLLVRLLA